MTFWLTTEPSCPKQGTGHCSPAEHPAAQSRLTALLKYTMSTKMFLLTPNLHPSFPSPLQRVLRGENFKNVCWEEKRTLVSLWHGLKQPTSAKLTGASVPVRTPPGCVDQEPDLPWLRGLTKAHQEWEDTNSNSSGVHSSPPDHSRESLSILVWCMWEGEGGQLWERECAALNPFS